MSRDIQADQALTGRQFLFLIGRKSNVINLLLTNKESRVKIDQLRPALPLSICHVSRGCLRQIRQGLNRLDNQSIQIFQHIFTLARLTAPPGRNRRHFQIGAKKITTDPRQKGHQGRISQHTATDRINQRHISPPHCLQQAGHSAGMTAQFQRIAGIISQARKNHIDLTQTIDRF